MRKNRDLTGRRFGKLTAVGPTGEQKNGYTIWLCKCDCGNVVRAPSRYLKYGWVTSCGCVERKPRYEDLTGKRFGKLVVVSKAEGHDERGRLLWNCVCDCGNTIVTPGGQLRGGYRKSCGCLSRPPLKDLTGKVFGNLTVIAYDGKRDRKHYWKCVCKCGKETSVCQYSLTSGHTTSCGCMNRPSETKHFVEGTCIENIRSRRVPKNNTSGIRGVYRSVRSGKWCAQITFQGRTRYLGSYSTLEEAERARKKGEELFDEFLAKYDAEHTQEKAGSAEEKAGYACEQTSDVQEKAGYACEQDRYVREKTGRTQKQVHNETRASVHRIRRQKDMQYA
ncbi:MAG: transcriptional regulator [Lachnospiraceae bacterium]|nr:transcriptional regulator [Lachnospiraceae bacterium]